VNHENLDVMNINRMKMLRSNAIELNHRKDFESKNAQIRVIKRERKMKFL